MLPGIGLAEMAIIFLAVMVILGPKAIPDIAKGLAKATKTIRDLFAEFHQSKNELEGLTDFSKKSLQKEWDTSHDFDEKQERPDWRSEINKDKN